MKTLSISFLIHFFTFLLLGVSGFAAESKRAANTIILDETGVKNLRILTVQVQERLFESTVFAIGRVEDIPANHYSISSRVPGRAIEVNAFIGDEVKKGQVLVKVESRHPGDPPPVISLSAYHDGIVVTSHVLKGQPVEPNQDLLDISDRSEVWVVASIPEQMAAGITVGTNARISFPAIGGDPVEGNLLRFGVKADRNAGTVDGIFQIRNPDGRLQPGMRAEFNIIVGARPNVLAVPEESVQGDPSRRVVYVKGFDIPNAFIQSPVVLGEKSAGWIEVKSGLFPGDEVVTRGSYPLGFAGGGDVSLREALDAAHGHAHNEDGSEMNGQQVSGESGEHANHDDGANANEGGQMNRYLLIYAIAISLLALALAQILWNSKRMAAFGNERNIGSLPESKSEPKTKTKSP